MAEIDSPSGQPPGIVDLPAPGVPADRGLPALGLLMQASGRTFAALAVLAAAIVLATRRPGHDGWILLVLLGCAGRSYLHQLAGRGLAHPGRAQADGSPAQPFAALRLYILFGIGHAILIGAMAPELGASSQTAVGILLALGLWPVALAVVLHQLRRSGLALALPSTADRGLEGAAILMTVLGACGAAGACALVAALGALRPLHAAHGPALIAGAALTMLAVRSAIQIRAGLAGLAGPELVHGTAGFARLDDRTRGYAQFGVMSGLVVTITALGMLAHRARTPGPLLLAVLAVGGVLLAWPTLIQRYIHHRQLAGLVEGDRRLVARAPDAGLSALAWLLVGHAVVIAALVVLALNAGGTSSDLSVLVVLLEPILGRAAEGLVPACGVLVLELVTAVALLRMSEHRRALATIYGLVACAVTLALSWSTSRRLAASDGAVEAAIQLVPAAIQLVIPIATWLLVHRAIEPGARARFRWAR